MRESTAPPQKRNADISVVLNIHREADYIDKTVRSISAAATEAVQCGLLVELVAVFDRSDRRTQDIFHSGNTGAYCSTIEIAARKSAQYPPFECRREGARVKAYHHPENAWRFNPPEPKYIAKRKVSSIQRTKVPKDLYSQ